MALGLGVAIVLSLPSIASAGSSSGYSPKFPDDDFAIGPSVAYVRGPGNGVSVNLDTSYTCWLFTGSLNLKYDRHPSTGTTRFGPQAEFTFWFLANVGGGVGYLWGSENGIRASGHVYHVFVGLPLGDDFLPKAMKPFKTGYIEPYMRVNFFYPHGLQVIYEFGLLFKISTYTL
jgi:hypothetical protein